MVQRPLRLLLGKRRLSMLLRFLVPMRRVWPGNCPKRIKTMFLALEFCSCSNESFRIADTRMV